MNICTALTAQFSPTVPELTQPMGWTLPPAVGGAVTESSSREFVFPDLSAARHGKLGWGEAASVPQGLHYPDAMLAAAKDGDSYPHVIRGGDAAEEWA